MANFNGHITEARPYMEDVLLEYIETNPIKFVFLEDSDKKIKLYRIFNITYFNLLSGDIYYNGTCEVKRNGKYSHLGICIYEKEIKMLERKLKIQKLKQNNIKG